MPANSMNPALEILKASRKKPQAGDIFVLKPTGYDFYFGRVIRTDARIVSFENCILIYVYNVASSEPNLEHLHKLKTDSLLLPPVIINRLPWSRGYFMTVGNQPLQQTDVLEVHCFKRFNGRYYDDESNELSAPIEPIGEFGLASYSTVGEEVHEALRQR
jgi:hypothetical protein